MLRSPTINFRCGTKPNNRGFCDSDLAGDIDSTKSTSRIIFFLGENPISWQSVKQKVVSLSSCEAEYIVAATVTCQAIWLARLLSEIQSSVVSRPVLWVVRLGIENRQPNRKNREPEPRKLVPVRFLILGNRNAPVLRFGSSVNGEINPIQHLAHQQPNYGQRPMRNPNYKSLSHSLPPPTQPSHAARPTPAATAPAPSARSPLACPPAAAHSRSRGRLPPPRSTQLRLRPAPAAAQRPTLVAAAHLLQSIAAAPGPPFVLCQPQRVPPHPLLTSLIRRSSLRSRARGAVAGGGGQAGGEPPPSSQVRWVASW
jgi:hypothetical protein